MHLLKMIANSEAETSTLAKRLAKVITIPCFITLSGQLGAGKTTFTRGLLQALGFTGKVKSPTFTIVESYPLSQVTVYHFDLYRIYDIAELELIGIRDYFEKKALILLEWPEHAATILPVADIECNIEVQEKGRVFTFIAHTKLGISLLQLLKANDV